MSRVRVVFALVAMMVAQPVLAMSDLSVADAFVKAVKHRQDLSAAYPGVIPATENEILDRISACSPTNLMQQSKGRFTVVWQCRKLAESRGMEIKLEDGKVVAISTFPVVAGPVRES